MMDIDFQPACSNWYLSTLEDIFFPKIKFC